MFGQVSYHRRICSNRQQSAPNRQQSPPTASNLLPPPAITLQVWAAQAPRVHMTGEGEEKTADTMATAHLTLSQRCTNGVGGTGSSDRFEQR